MRAPLLALAVLLCVGIIADAYIYVQTRRRCQNPLWSRLTLWSSIALVALMVVAMCLPARFGSEQTLAIKMWTLFAWLSVYASKYVGVIVDLIASAPRLFRRDRLHWLTKAGIGLSAILFAAMWWGALINRYRIDVRHVEVPVENLPPAFDGMTIAQFSDLHTGTFGSDTTFVAELVDRINALHADVIVFTGDIVNRRMIWSSTAHKQLNMQRLYDLYRHTPMRLLLNETEWLRRGNDSIALIGVENIGDPPFTIYGSLSRAYPALSDSNSKILLTHNPQHWVDSIAATPDANVALTLSGHTHAMQIELGGISPAAWRYPTWGGLYSDSTGRRHLYVNIGAGTVGIPMRMGATPEITLITLRSR